MNPYRENVVHVGKRWGATRWVRLVMRIRNMGWKRCECHGVLHPPKHLWWGGWSETLYCDVSDSSVDKHKTDY